MVEKEKLEAIFTANECGDFKWINPTDIVVANWVRLKCQFGCPLYGNTAVCPPNTPSIDECRALFKEYGHAVLFRFKGIYPDSKDRKVWGHDKNERLLEIERQTFLAGYHKAFTLFMSTCNFCSTCLPHREECRLQLKARPHPEGMGIDLFETVRKAGFNINVLQNQHDEMNRYAILLVH